MEKTTGEKIAEELRRSGIGNEILPNEAIEEGCKKYKGKGALKSYGGQSERLRDEIKKDK